jgi:hypothetical protein
MQCGLPWGHTSSIAWNVAGHIRKIKQYFVASFCAFVVKYAAFGIARQGWGSFSGVIVYCSAGAVFRVANCDAA